MKINRFWNNKKRGMIEFLFYKEKDKYVGVCLTFDIIEEGDDFIKLKQSVEEAARLHLEVVIKKNLSDDLLNRYAPEEYWKKYFGIQCLTAQEKVEEKKIEREICKDIPAILTFPYSSKECALVGL